MIAYNAKGDDNDPNTENVEQQATKYLYTSTINASWQTAVVYPDSTDTVQSNADGSWSIASGSDLVSTTYDRLGEKLLSDDRKAAMDVLKKRFG
jgi:hypothetical protein